MGRWRQSFERGHAASKLKDLGPAPNRRGTIVSFKPDEKIFGSAHFSPRTLYRMARSKAYLFRGVEIRWRCDPSLLKPEWEIPPEDMFKFPGGLLDFLRSSLGSARTVARPFFGQIQNRGDKGTVEWAVAWAPEIDPFVLLKEIIANLNAASANAIALIESAISLMSQRRDELQKSPALHALQLGIWSDKAKIPPEEVRRLGPLWLKYFET